MYLRRHDKKVAGEEYEYWSLVESVRTARGPRQRIVATIGKLPGLDRDERIGWDEIGRILSGKPRPEPELFSQPEEPPSWATVNINGVSVERLRHFGDTYLGLLLWNRLGLATFCRETIPPGREDIPWSIMAAILVVARFCSPSSELQIAESWYDKTALDDLLGVSSDKINDDRLYRALDFLLPHKDDLCRHLQKRYGELFGTTFDFLFYDVTSTYSRGAPKETRRPKGVTAATSALTVPKSASAWWPPKKDFLLPMKSLMAIAPTLPPLRRWWRSWRRNTAKPTGWPPLS